jgi:ferric-dicitrate binding protein FerR (iron transport regulator)
MHAAPALSRPESARDEELRGPRTVDLGDRARFVLSAGSRATLAEVAPCRTVLALGAGTVAVHARDLEGGELVVRAAAADVVVHGTVFEVAVGERGERLEVAVAEGEVGVVQGEELARLVRGDGVRVSDDGTVETLEIREGALARLLDRVAGEPVREPRRPRTTRETRSPPRGEVTDGVPEVHQPSFRTMGGFTPPD